MAGFNSPSLLFLNTWDKPERDWNFGLLRQAKRAGYTRMVELYCGAFANLMVARQAGWEPSEIVASDVWLYTAALGYVYSGQPLANLQVTVDNEPLPLSGDSVKDAATIIGEQYKARIAKHEDIDYMRQLLEDLDRYQQEHMQGLVGKITQNDQILHGITFKSEDSLLLAKEVMDDPHTIVFANPPTYKGAYEKFFDTQGRVDWAAPPYEVFDAQTDIPKLVEMFHGKHALLIAQQQQTPRNSASPHPVYARSLGLDSVIYMNSNRPDEVKQLTGGVKVTVRPEQERAIPIPLIDEDYRITSDTDIKLCPLLNSGVQDAYLQVLRHRLSTQPSPMCLLLLLDGKVAGIIGYAVPTPYRATDTSIAILRQAFGAPHSRYRLTKLATMVSLRKSTLQLLSTPKTVMRNDSTEKLVTVEYTRYPEAKGLRGLMKLTDRKKKKGTYELHYESVWKPEIGLQAILKQFVDKEEKRYAGKAK